MKKVEFGVYPVIYQMRFYSRANSLLLLMIFYYQ